MNSEGPPHILEDQRLVACAGGCSKHEPIYKDTAYGQRLHVGSWICPECHSRVCEVDVIEDPFHTCKALELL